MAQEIAQLSQAISTFKTQFAVPAPPSRIRLRETGHYDPTDPLDVDSLAYLKRMFRRLTFPVNWKGYGEPGSDWTLEGDQCLVFFLGGIPSGKEDGPPTGFSTNPANPAKPGGDRIGPFFELVPKRLRRQPKNPFASYLDGYGKQPYAYFSSPRKENDYYCYAEKYGSDCARLKVWPYAESLDPLRCLKPKKFQIISAGADGAFGSGTDPKNEKTTWKAAEAKTSKQGHDDQSNFHPTLLGTPAK